MNLVSVNGCKAPPGAIPLASTSDLRDKDVILVTDQDHLADAVVDAKAKGAKRIITINSESVDFDHDISEAKAHLAAKAKKLRAPSSSLLDVARVCSHPYPVKAFGEHRQMIEQLARLAGAPVEFVGGTLLAATSGLVTGSIKVVVRPGFSVAPILWIALVGDASSGKSPAQDLVLSPLRQLEAEAYSSGDHEADSEGKPFTPRAIVSNATIEALQHVAAEQERGMLCAYDELSEWFNSIKRYAKSSSGDRGLWLTAHNGYSTTIDRRSLKQPLFVPCWGAAVVGGIPPSVLSGLSRTSELNNGDGLDVRLVYLRPALPPITKRPNSADEIALPKLNALMAKLWRFRNRGQPPKDLPFSRSAREKFEDWRYDLLNGARSKGGEVDSWTGKLPGLVARFAGTLAMLDNIGCDGPEEITLDVLRRAGSLADNATAHRNKILLERGAPSQERLAAELGAWCLQHKIEAFSPYEVRRAGIAGIRTEEDLHKVLIELQSAAWITTTIDSRRNSTLPDRVNLDKRIFAYG